MKIPERIAYLKKLKNLILEAEPSINEALKTDLNKPEIETYGSEVAPVLEEIEIFIESLPQWARLKKVPTAWWKIAHLGAESFIEACPKGRVLIIGPWNYPFHLSLMPVIGAFAAGNQIVLKPSELAPATSRLIKDLMEKWVSSDRVQVIEGDAIVSENLVKQGWDHLFFTGGTEIGKKIMKSAADTLTPVTLELGGKSPCVLDSKIDVKKSMKRILWGKFYNSGQTCVAPDYLLVPKGRATEVAEAFRYWTKEFFGESSIDSSDYARIISKRHFDRLQKMLDDTGPRIGGESNPEKLKIAPALVMNPNLQSNLMKEEIFGPILPVIEYENENQIMETISRHPDPLALYIFSQDSNFQRNIISKVKSGGVCVNDVLIHLGNAHLPFGGIRNSGIGAYHGHESFKTFTHFRSIERKNTFFDLPQRFAPYKMKLNRFLKFFV